MMREKPSTIYKSSVIDRKMYSVLNTALSGSDVETVRQRLVEDPNLIYMASFPFNPRTLFIRAIELGSDDKTLRMMLEFKPDLYQEDYSSKDSLSYLIKYKRFDVIDAVESIDWGKTKTKILKDTYYHKNDVDRITKIIKNFKYPIDDEELLMIVDCNYGVEIFDTALANHTGDSHKLLKDITGVIQSTEQQNETWHHVKEILNIYELKNKLDNNVFKKVMKINRNKF